MDLTCSSCAYAFFTDPLKMGLVLVSFTLAIAFFLYLRYARGISNGRKLGLIYAHIFFLVFPVVFYMLFRGCTTYFSNCDQLKPVIALLFLTGLTAGLLGAVIAPFLFIRKHARISIPLREGHLADVVRKHGGRKKAQLYMLDTAKPLAFSTSHFSHKIFVSIGLADLLTKKEKEAVVLHELAHLHNKSSLLKSSTFLLGLVSPLSNFSSIHSVTQEEEKADRFAAARQGTWRYVRSAKQKINEFYRES
ncbi:M48 family metalloprotease [Candidatus Woesearchaeota archaeon]|nr:M48 family metalloprotease [Candidatus Woesearchaeota archaeon]